MINIGICIAIGLGIFILFSYLGFHWILALIIGNIAALVSFFILSKMIVKKISAILEASNKEVSKNRMDQAISIINNGFKYKNHHPFITSQLNSQLGVIYYCKRDIKKAEIYLKKGISTHFIAQCMLANIYIKRNEIEKMDKVFKSTLRTNSKESFVWSMYAYCLDKAGKRDQAIAVLNKAQKKLPNDEKIKRNLRSLQNNQKVKMKSYKEIWPLIMQEKIIVKQKIRNPSRLRYQRAN